MTAWHGNKHTNMEKVNLQSYQPGTSRTWHGGLPEPYL
uniref:Uncharacterized protein n=1 Tax=Manihot esculenta TaxID=3983 RepID=A0A2C9WJQ7_MANES